MALATFGRTLAIRLLLLLLLLLLSLLLEINSENNLSTEYGQHSQRLINQL